MIADKICILKIRSQVQQTNSSVNCILLHFKLSLSKYNIHIRFVGLKECTVEKYSEFSPKCKNYCCRKLKSTMLG